MQITWDATEVLVAIIGLIGVIFAPVLVVLIKRRKDRAPDAVTQSQALARTETTLGVDRDTLIMAQRAVNQVSMVMDQQETTQQRLAAIEGQLAETKAELGVLKRSYRQLLGWAHDLRDHWPVYRLRDEPPPLPEDIHEP